MLELVLWTEAVNQSATVTADTLDDDANNVHQDTSEILWHLEAAILAKSVIATLTELSEFYLTVFVNASVKLSVLVAMSALKGLTTWMLEAVASTVSAWVSLISVQAPLCSVIQFAPHLLHNDLTSRSFRDTMNHLKLQTVFVLRTEKLLSVTSLSVMKLTTGVFHQGLHNLNICENFSYNFKLPQLPRKQTYGLRRKPHIHCSLYTSTIRRCF